METPGSKGITEEFSCHLHRNDHRDQHCGSEPKIAGALQRDEGHGQRSADHQNRQCAHTDDGIGIRVGMQSGPDRTEHDRKQLSAERTQQQRGEEQTAAETDPSETMDASDLSRKISAIVATAA